MADTVTQTTRQTLKADKLKPTYVQIHLCVEKGFFDDFLIAIKRLHYKTQAEFFRHCMRSAISEAERRVRMKSPNLSRHTETNDGKRWKGDEEICYRKMKVRIV
jgi:hypothetical protein